MEQANYTHWKRNSTFFLLGQTFSLFGSMLVDFAIIWHITIQTNSGVMLTIATMCAFVPRLIISLFAGVWADRYSRKLLIMLSDSLIALSTLAVAFIFMAGYREIWVLLLVSAGRSLGAGIQEPAVGAAITQLVPEAERGRINGLRGSTQGFVQILAPLASAALMEATTLDRIFFIDVVTAMLAVGMMFMIRLPAYKRDESAGTSYVAELKVGIRYIWRNAFTRRLVALYAIFLLAMSPVAFLTTLYIQRTFGPEVWRLSANEVVFGVGMIAGGIIIAAWGGFKNRIDTMSASTWLFGITLIGLGFAGNFIVYLAVMLLMGLTMPAFSSPVNTLLQEQVDPGMQGRVFGLLGLLATMVLPLGMGIFGPVSDWLRIDYLFMGTGVVIVLLGVWMFTDRTMKSFGVKPATVVEK